ncbi:MAG TPA: hypothetical protein VK249_17070, partial [Anaerolineales bacterium]|nr:hypothetical protein [Anaerolineales bacterium]
HPVVHGMGWEGYLFILLFVLKLSLLLNIKLWFFPLFLIPFIFFASVSAHSPFSFLVDLRQSYPSLRGFS